MFLLFLLGINCYQDLFKTIESKIDRLHQLTGFATYYELFNLSENCSEGDIKKTFRKLRNKKNDFPAGLTKEKFDELLMHGYSLLANYKEAYDNFLRDSKFIYLNKTVNYKRYFIVPFIAFVCVLIFIDFVVYAIKYFKYLEELEKQKKLKKEGKKAEAKYLKKEFKLLKPSMISKRMLSRVSTFFSRKQ